MAHLPTARLYLEAFGLRSNQLMFICDRRSEKIAQIQQQPNTEACWYFTKTREQFRLRGQLTPITADTSPADLAATRRQLWQKISDNARLQFVWPQPGAARVEDSDAFSPRPPDSQEPLDTFCALLLTPQEIDYLSLRGRTPRPDNLSPGKGKMDSKGYQPLSLH